MNSCWELCSFRFVIFWMLVCRFDAMLQLLVGWLLYVSRECTERGIRFFRVNYFMWMILWLWLWLWLCGRKQAPITKQIYIHKYHTHYSAFGISFHLNKTRQDTWQFPFTDIDSVEYFVFCSKTMKIYRIFTLIQSSTGTDTNNWILNWICLTQLDEKIDWRRKKQHTLILRRREKTEK